MYNFATPEETSEVQQQYENIANTLKHALGQYHEMLADVWWEAGSAFSVLLGGWC